MWNEALGFFVRASWSRHVRLWWRNAATSVFIGVGSGHEMGCHDVNVWGLGPFFLLCQASHGKPWALNMSKLLEVGGLIMTCNVVTRIAWAMGSSLLHRLGDVMYYCEDGKEAFWALLHLSIAKPKWSQHAMSSRGVLGPGPYHTGCESISWSP